jgi:HAD superfamily hydrolase (TIGR01484 family)
VAELPKILICSDLDRTLIPNGCQEESAHARPVFRQLVEHSNIYLAYVSGRDKSLIMDAIEEFYLPMPDYAIGDVGTILYHIRNNNWIFSDEWSDEIGQDWKGASWEELVKYFEDIDDIRLQEPERQSRCKLSFYTDQDVDHPHLKEKIRLVLAQKALRANIIWSVDEFSGIGLLDIIPARANKLHAIQFLMKQEQFLEDKTIFAGDSGNDLDVLTSGLKAILVKNAIDDVRKKAVETLSAKHMMHQLYFPKGNYCGMNGNYAAGVLEGLVHFFPETEKFIANIVEQVKGPAKIKKI